MEDVGVTLYCGVEGAFPLAAGSQRQDEDARRRQRGVLIVKRSKGKLVPPPTALREQYLKFSMKRYVVRFLQLSAGPSCDRREQAPPTQPRRAEPLM